MITYDNEKILVSTVPMGLAPAKVAAYPQFRKEAHIMVSEAAVLFLCHGPDPDAATANYLEPGDILKLDSLDDMQNFRAIRRDGVDAVLSVNYHRSSYGQ